MYKIFNVFDFYNIKNLNFTYYVSFVLKNNYICAIVDLRGGIQMAVFSKEDYGFCISKIEYVYYRNFPANYTFTHAKKRCAVLYYVVSGEIECIKNGKSTILRNNNFFFWDYGDDQKIINNTEEDCYVYVIGFEFTPIEAKHSDYNLPSYGTIESDYLNSQFAKIHHTWNHEQKGYIPKSFSQLYNIIYNIISLSGIDENTTLTHYKIQKVVQYIYAQYATDIKIEDLCNISGYSKVHLNRLFIEHYQMSPKKFINNFKISKAKELLEETSYPVSEIATRVGICDVTYFCRLFKKLTSYTPIEYKKMFFSRYL